MANNVPEGVALFEFQKMQLINSLAAVADQMRNCAAIADQFSTLISHVPFNPNGQALPMIPPIIPTQRGKRKADATDEDGTVKKKRIKKIKDPNAPKRPASSYILFQNDIRTQLRAEHPDVPYSELMARVSKLWNELPSDQKEKYEHLQAQAKKEYVRKKKEYDEQHGVISPSTPAAEAPSEAESSSPAAVRTTSIVKEDEEEDSDAEESKAVSSSGSEDEDEDEDEDEEEPAPALPVPVKKKSKMEAPPTPSTPAPKKPRGMTTPAPPSTKEKKHKKVKV